MCRVRQGCLYFERLSLVVLSQVSGHSKEHTCFSWYSVTFLPRFEFCFSLYSYKGVQVESRKRLDKTRTECFETFLCFRKLGTVKKIKLQELLSSRCLQGESLSAPCSFVRNLKKKSSNAHHASGPVIILQLLPRCSGQQLSKQMIRNNASHLQLPCAHLSLFVLATVAEIYHKMKSIFCA